MRKKVLIVDDEELTLMMTEQILSSKYDTLRALSGEEGIKIYGEEKPDLILSDLMMPGMDGFEMLKAIKAEHGNAIPIIFMTAHEGEETELQSLVSGAVDFVRKPLKAGPLMECVDSFMARIDSARAEGGF